MSRSRKSENLLELKREAMIGRTRSYSEARYDRRRNYVGRVRHYAGYEEYSRKGSISMLMVVGDYKAIVQFDNIKSLVDNRYPDSIPSRSQVQSLLNNAIDNLNLRVFCSCADFKYRFHYVVTQFDSLPDGIPGQPIPTNITNPYAKGFLCKHLIAILARPSNWMSRAVTLLREAIRYDRGDEGYDE